MPNSKEPAPAMICYYGSPNSYLTDNAETIRGLYDGFFFICGSWDTGVANMIGVGDSTPTNSDWLPMARQNVAALKLVGIAENFLGVSFGDGEPWPSPETLFSKEFTGKMRHHFGALGKAAKECGFCGVCIDVEYPYPRYFLQHEVYTYEGYTPDDVLRAAYTQARAAMSAILDEFPDAVVFVLPGTIRTKPIEQKYQLGLLDEMAARQAPGGFHLGTEYAYCLHDPVTQAAIPRYEDTGMPELLSPESLAYWREHGTMAPGVWPTHMVETGGQ